ncbi:MAG: hypothetical protein K6G54_09390 [Oscillospiraceae bacterium]|nr:hypothetical protein [Oscillospiraceae bacterium]
MELFRKNIEKRCAYCVHGSRINDAQVACTHKGIVDAAGQCHRFVYDPLRRMPPRPAALKTERYSEEDFTL